MYVVDSQITQLILFYQFCFYFSLEWNASFHSKTKYVTFTFQANFNNSPTRQKEHGEKRIVHLSPFPPIIFLTTLKEIVPHTQWCMCTPSNRQYLFISFGPFRKTFRMFWMRHKIFFFKPFKFASRVICIYFPWMWMATRNICSS